MSKSNKINTRKESKNNNPIAKEIAFNKWIGPIAIIFLGLLIYSNSYDCSFQLDDKNNIINNETIRSLSNIKEIWNLSHTRFIVYLSFALNYQIGQLNVWGYHFVNILIHLINAILVFGITKLLFKSPVLKTGPLAKQAALISVFTGLLFVSHPLATGAVTYIVQRMAAMAAMFYLIAIATFLIGRLTETKIKYGYFACTFIAGVMALLSKENAYTLPFAILLIEFFFFNTQKNRINLKDYRILSALAGISIFILFMIFNFSFSVFNPLPPSKFNSTAITSTNYFFTQISVIVKYIQLLILPINQNIDYDFPVSNSLFELSTLMNGVILLSLLLLGVYLFNKNRIFSFSIFWFFLTLCIESSFIPISDVIFEHRTYLPSFGFFIMVSTGIFQFVKNKNTVILIFVCLIGVNSILTYQRNTVWKNEITLWSDAIEKSPAKARPYLNRGYAYGNMQRWDKAIPDFSKVNEIEPEFHAAAYYNLGIAFWALGQKDKSFEYYSHTIQVDSNYADAYWGRGLCYYFLNDYDKALSDYSRAISISSKPQYYFNRGIVYANQQKWNEAISDYTQAIEKAPNNADIYYNRGVVYGNINQWAKAADDFTKTLQLNPDNKSAYSNREFAYGKMKQMGVQ